jgi:hypothetical protein
MTRLKRPRRIFLLSPAYTGGERARLVLNERGRFDLAVRLRKEGVPLGEVYAFVSGLYFRGKLAYATAFASPPKGLPGSYIITPGRGLVTPETVVTLPELLGIADVPVDSSDLRYALPLARDAQDLVERAGPDCDFILLGSVATTKYLEPLIEIAGNRLRFPIDFIGRGDMSRGGLLLRCARYGVELSYVPAMGATRHGKRPPNLG